MLLLALRLRLHLLHGHLGHTKRRQIAESGLEGVDRAAGVSLCSHARVPERAGAGVLDEGGERARGGGAGHERGAVGCDDNVAECRGVDEGFHGLK